MSDRSPVPPANEVAPPPPPAEKPKQPSPMKVWFMKAILDDPEVQRAVVGVLTEDHPKLFERLLLEHEPVRRAIRQVCIEDILSVADKAPAPPSGDLLLQLRTYLRPDAFRSPYGG